MKVVTNYQTGLKYSFREHGLRSRLIAAFAAFVVAFGGALALASPAQAAPAGAVFVTVCGNSTAWYVNSDETAREPLATADGLVFSPSDLIHQTVSLPLASLKPGSFVASPAPDQPSFFSVEVVNSNGAYGTLRWDTTQSLWSITIGATNNGKTLDGTANVTDGTFTGADPVALLTGKVTKWGAFTPSTATVISFGVGYTQTPPGTVTALVSKVSFNGTDYALACPAPTVTVAVPGPTVVVTKNQTVYVQAPAPSASTVTVTPSPSLTTSPYPTATTTDVVLPAASPASGSGSGFDWTLWALIAAVALFLLLVLIGIVKAAQKRRAAEANQYVGAHATDNDRTQVIPAIRDNTYFDGGYDPKLGGWAGENYPLGHDGYGPEPDESATVQAPKVSEEPPPGDSDTRPLPPVQG